MKQGIHPKLNKITVNCACGNKFETTSTLERLVTDSCSNCHPFFTGKSTFVDAEGRIDAFNRKKKLASQNIKSKSKPEPKSENQDNGYRPTLKDIFNQSNN